jgi:hypothetical protein
MRRRTTFARLLHQMKLAHEGPAGLFAFRTSKHDNGISQIFDCKIRAEDHHLRGSRHTGNPLSSCGLA